MEVFDNHAVAETVTFLSVKLMKLHHYKSCNFNLILVQLFWWCHFDLLYFHAILKKNFWVVVHYELTLTWKGLHAPWRLFLFDKLKVHSDLRFIRRELLGECAVHAIPKMSTQPIVELFDPCKGWPNSKCECLLSTVQPMFWGKVHAIVHT